MLIEIKQKWDVLLRCNKNYVILAFNCILKYSKGILLVLETFFYFFYFFKINNL